MKSRVMPLSYLSKIFWWLLLVVSLFGEGAAESQTPGSLDSTFQNPTVLGSGSVYATLIQNDGKILIGGAFGIVNGVARASITRLNADGSLDASFNLGSGIGGTVGALALQPDGKIVIGGGFIYTNGATRSGIARLNPDGSFDTGFNQGAGLNDSPSTIMLQTDGKILIGGSSLPINGVTHNGLARLKADGSADTEFNPDLGVGGNVYAIAVQADGKIVVGGSFSTVNGVARNGLARLNADGSLDATFNPGTGDIFYTYSLVVQGDDKIVVGGYFASVNGVARQSIARLNADGGTDTSFDPGAGIVGDVDTAVLQADGKLVIGGYLVSVNNVARRGIARLNANGSLDLGFDPGAGTDVIINSVAVQADGKVVIGGGLSSFNGVPRKGIVRLNADGSVENEFDPEANLRGTVNSLAVQTDNKLVVGGNFSFVNGMGCNNIARLNTDGSLDTGFKPATGVNGPVYAITVQADGKIVVGGDFTSVNNVTRNKIVRLNVSGSLDTTFNPGTGADGTVKSVALQSDGKILVGGSFTSVNGVSSNRLARLNTNGSVDTGFSQASASGSVNSVTVQADGKIVMGGTFATINGVARNGIARLNVNGSLDVGFKPRSNTTDFPYAVVVQTDGRILEGGGLALVNQAPSQFILRLSTNGNLDTRFSASTAIIASVRSVAVQPDGKIVVGYFTSVNQMPRGYITRLSADGSLDAGFDPGVAPNNAVYAVALQADGKIVIGGAFTLVDGISRFGLARLFGDPLQPAVTSSLDANGQVGAAFRYQITATKTPTSFSAGGLPGGLSIDAATGTISGTPTQAGNFSVSLSATNSAGTGTAVLALTIFDTLANWQASNFTTVELGDPMVSGPLGDATGTGVSNLVRYALGIPAKRPGLAGLPTTALQSPVGGGTPAYLTLTYTRNKLASDISLAVQVSGDLSTWDSGAGAVTEISRTDNGNGTETVVTRDNATVSNDSPRRFIRLQVTQP